MAINLAPGQMVQDFGKVTDEQAKRIANTAMQIAAQKLQGFRSMAGTPAGTPLRTIDRTKSDLDNALTRVDAYQKLSGKVPEMDFLNQVGLQGTLGPIAGQPTYDAQMDAIALARKGSGGGGKAASVKDLTKAEAGDLLRTSLMDEFASFTKNQDEDPRKTGNSVSDNAAYWTASWALKNPQFKNTAAYYGVDVKGIIDDFLATQGQSPGQFFGKGGAGEQLGDIYNSKYNPKGSTGADDTAAVLERMGIKLPGQ